MGKDLYCGGEVACMKRDGEQDNNGFATAELVVFERKTHTHKTKKKKYKHCTCTNCVLLVGHGKARLRAFCN